MHEMALIESVVEIAEEVARQNGARRIIRLRLDIGELSIAEPDALTFCFAAVTQGTMAQDAELEICRVAGRGWCLDCATEIAMSQRFGTCPICGSHQVQVTGGDDLKIKDIEIN
ncbi:MAG: hydrogenase maturation nickel metallochaperone HypA [Hyphomicrobiales bacterium]|nr:hydrogenase maturation nickel metallochaperone HypA [Hyphomicrobiales bacterium]MDE2115391.1 hydrogenase maturation nickel metallochaperone HypA [Hyphomicrobiales bacterium]